MYATLSSKIICFVIAHLQPEACTLKGKTQSTHSYGTHENEELIFIMMMEVTGKGIAEDLAVLRST